MMHSMPFRFLPLATGLLPIIAIHASLLLAIVAGAIAPCIPYLDGCASISATGRYEPAVFLFKPAMTVEAVLMVCYWISNAIWLRALSRVTGQHAGPSTALMSILGVVSALALIVYVTFLGTQTPIYEFMRKFGIYFYFLFSVIAQIMLAGKVLGLSKQLELVSVATISRMQLWLAAMPLALGALNLALKLTLDDADSAENMIEWTSALLMHVYYVLTYFSWRDTAFGFNWTVELRRG